MYKKGDFHLHTKNSDGKLSPKELVNLAKKEKVDIIAVTDHDTVAGVEEAIEEGNNMGVKVIPGLELSTLYNGKNVHVLGYFKDVSLIHEEFRIFLKDITNYRIYRAKKIVENLHEFFNINLNYEKILKDTHGVVARPHIAKAIIEAGYDYSWEYIFEKFIGEGSPAYFPNKKLSTEEGIKLLQSINALIVLAHPVLIKNINLEELLKLPFHGIEAIYPMNSEKDTKKLLNYANDYKKIITAGSDFHGISDNDSKHSSTIGEVFLDEKGIELFLNKLNNI
ncbi:PHP domain-containing protein [Clostridium sp. PL3]|uniref:PHP domain-containing protein n=1 Tax=Clostridium thailandense TaxID=2794346 RepID=A0A949U1H5_9CLOT|nr:PHP domain-containing protein [Clostridium thailandense]MBV7274574.1 PHP domain-containing protein [Clostridium thailandense]